MSFDRIAPYYDRLAGLVFGKSIRRAQVHFLDQIPPSARVLIVGGGTGWLLTHVLSSTTVAHITYLEMSATMLAMAQRQTRRVHPSCTVPVDFIHGDERSLPEGRTFSVVITNFVLDMYESTVLDELIRVLATHLTPDGRWLFTDFRLSSQRKHRIWQLPMTFIMYLFFHLTAGITRQRLPSYQQHFAAGGFRRVKEQTFFGDFIVSRVYQRK